MITFIYLDYGPSPYYRREALYSIATLLAELGDRSHAIEIYTDKPSDYRAMESRVAIRDISDALPRYTRDGRYPHRAKPALLLDALRSHEGPCALIDTDSYVTPGFAERLEAALQQGVAMDHFEEVNPYPAAVGFQTVLPHAGAYRYDPAQSSTYNSGLIAADPARHLSALEDALALIDALFDSGFTLFKIEQIAISEAFRIHGIAVGETRPQFQHYYRRSLKRYMHWRIDRWMRKCPRFAPTRPSITHPRNAVRIFNYVNRMIGRY